MARLRCEPDIHALKRANERYGVQPTPAEWAELCLDILDTAAGLAHKAVLLERQPSGRERWLVRLSGMQVIVVWDPSNKTQKEWQRPLLTHVVTVLPNEPRKYGYSSYRRADGRRPNNVEDYDDC